MAISVSLSVPEDPTCSDTQTLSITFGESVTGFELSDIVVTNGTASNFSGSGASYTADITADTAPSVEITVEIPGAATNEGNDNEFLSWTYDDCSSSSSSSSSSVSSSYSSVKSAIVRACGAWIGWFCIERPVPMFTDVIEVPIEPFGEGDAMLPPEFLESCDPETIRAVSVDVSGAWARVGMLGSRSVAAVVVECPQGQPLPERALVTIEGRRRGVHPARWRRFTRAQKDANNRFYGRAYHA